MMRSVLLAAGAMALVIGALGEPAIGQGKDKGGPAGGPGGGPGGGPAGGGLRRRAGRPARRSEWAGDATGRNAKDGAGTQSARRAPTADRRIANGKLRPGPARRSRSRRGLRRQGGGLALLRRAGPRWGSARSRSRR
ncbi:hypothetical protein AB5I41_19565 [Sphingomonas sp. MMS24-JH45]